MICNLNATIGYSIQVCVGLSQRFKLEVSKIESLIYFFDVDSPIFDDSNWYCRLMGELLYLTIPHVDIAFIVGLLR